MSFNIELNICSPLTLKHELWPQSCVQVPASEARLLGNGEVCKEFDEDDHYIKPTSIRPLPSFRVTVDCHEGYMLLMYPRDETYVRPV